MELEKKLDEMVGNTYMYNTKNYKILKYYMDNGSTTFATDKDLINIKTEDLKKEIERFLPVDEEGSTAVTVLGRDKSELNELVTLVKNNIKSIKADPKNIPAAKAVNDSVKLIIEVAKLEINAVKLSRKI